MKILIALAVSALAVAPVLAQSADAPPTSRERECMTWLSLASRFAASEGQRSGFDQQYLRLNRIVSAGTDVVAQAAGAETSVTDATYDDWVMKYDLADDTTKATLVGGVIDKALGCADVVPDEAAGQQ